MLLAADIPWPYLYIVERTLFLLIHSKKKMEGHRTQFEERGHRTQFEERGHRIYHEG